MIDGAYLEGVAVGVFGEAEAAEAARGVAVQAEVGALQQALQGSGIMHPAELCVTI